MDARCDKKSTSLGTPFGVCSVQVGDSVIAVCPHRLLQDYHVFRDIALKHFHTLNDILLFREVGLKGVGNFDYVMVRHKPLSTDIEDFAVVEFQGGGTTSTGKLVQAFKEFRRGVPVGEKNYGFGLNLYDIWKRAFTQVLNKGIVVEHWGHKIYWVTQEQIFQDLACRYRLGELGFHESDATVFALYDHALTQGSLTLTRKRFVSASVDDLFRAFRNNPNIPAKSAFVKRLQCRIHQRLYISLRIGK